MNILRFICFIKLIYRSLKYAYWFGPGDDYISGCDYIELSNGDLQCKVCGNISKKA
jgi:hypothetical protein